jgi:hypothetical protein
MTSAGFTIVLKHRASLARVFIFLLIIHFTMDFCLCGAILNLKALFRNDSRHTDRVDSLLECATKQAVMTVAQWHKNQIIRGLWLLEKKSWIWIHAYVVQF